MKVFCLYDDGNHIGCYETYAEAEAQITDLSNGYSRYTEIEEEDFTPNCDCGNVNLTRKEAQDAGFKVK